MTSGNRESRFEELRRKAQERLREVRDNIQRGLEIPETHPPDRSEGVLTPVERQRPRTTPLEPTEEDREPEAWEQRVVVPSRREEKPAAETDLPTVAAAPAVHSSQSRAAGQAHLSPAARLLKRDNLRQAILAQEVLGKPLSMRPPQDDES